MADAQTNLRVPLFKRGKEITLRVDGKPIRAHEGESVHAVMAAAGIRTLRTSPKSGEPRGFFCGMGICYECLVTINHIPDQRACMTQAKEGMHVETGTGRQS